MSKSEQPTEESAWNNLAASFRAGLGESASEIPFGFATSVVARWKEDQSRWEYQALERFSLRLAVGATVASVAVSLVLLWQSAEELGEEWVELPPMEDVAW